MQIQFHCSNAECRRKLEVGDELAGKKVKCPKCKTVMVVPRPDSGTDASDSTGYEATMALEEGMGARECGSVGEGEGSEGTGVEALDAFLDEKRGRRAPFDVEREIARGGMGAVILARDRAIQRELAVKVMRPQIADSEEHRLRFLEEAQVTGQLEHPNIVPIHELGKDADGNLYFTMKLVKGKSLGELLKELRSVGEREYGSMGDGKADGTADPHTPTPPHAHTSSPPTPPHSHTPPLSLPDLLNIFLKVCDGMAFAHSKGVIHRDLKPDNIMVGEFGEVQIMDWGLAKVVGTRSAERGTGSEEEDEDANIQHPTSNTQHPSSEAAAHNADTVPAGDGTAAERLQSEIKNQKSKITSVRSDSDIALTVEGAVSGTPAYMPPEQAEGKLEEIDHRSDVYSLGAILYELLTLERPVEGQTIHQVLLNVADGKITPPEQRTPGRHIPKELSAVVMKAMAKSRRKRYQSVQELGQDIKLFLEGRSVSAKEDTFTEAFVKLIKRNRGVSAAVGAAAAIMIILTSFFMVNLKRERDEAVSQRLAAQQARNEMHENAMRSSKALAEQAVRAAEGARWAEAELRVEAAVQISPADGPWGAYAQGMLHKERKEFEKAEESFKKALSADTKHAPSIAALAQVQSTLGRLKDAVALIETIDGATDWRTLMAAGEALYESEEYKHAQTAFERTQKRMDSAKDVPADKRQRLEEMLGRAGAWVKCEGFWESIRDLPPKEQADRVGSKLRDLHGGGGGIASSTIREGVLTGMDVHGVVYLQPLRGLPLERLGLVANPLRDLGPLKGMCLQNLVCQNCLNVDDLAPLKGMPLSRLSLHGCKQVSDLSPLAGAELEELSLASTGVTDLSPLRGMPLKKLSLGGTKVSDIGPLSGMPLEFLDLGGARVHDLRPLKEAPLKKLVLFSCMGIESLEPLRGLPIEDLDLVATRIDDLGPLEGMPLSDLNVRANRVVRDLTPLKGMPLTSLNLDGAGRVVDIGPLQGMPLETLSLQMTAVKDLSRLKGMPLVKLDVRDTAVRDLSPLQGMPLKELNFANTDVSDVTPLRGMHLKELWLNGTKVTDLSQLKGIHFDLLGIEDTNVSDVSPLEGARLEGFYFDPGKTYKGIEVIRQMKSIVKIGQYKNPMKPEDFWKKYDAGEFR